MFEKKMYNLIDERFDRLKDDILKEEHVRLDQGNGIKKLLEIDIPKLNESLKQEEYEREEMDETLMRKIQD
jgi:hypothetical protein